MKAGSHIVAGGGWVNGTTVVGRPIARFFGFFSVIWFFVSIGASFPFWDGWPQTFDVLELLCLVLLVPHPVFVILALVFMLTEKPKTWTEDIPNPDYDVRKLY